MKFKVGDRVIVHDEVGSKRMDGEIGVIKHITSEIDKMLIEFDNNIGGHDGYFIKSFKDEHCWWVDCCNCELIKPETIVIYRHNDTVVAKNTQTGEKAVAKCHPDDKFEFNTGAAVAFDRLLGRGVKEEYYNSKVVCVDANGMSFTTTGKIYEVVDGQFYDDGGNLRPACDTVKSLEELNRYTLGKFIEVVE